MKTYYKYKYGFINIDENTVYLSATGNWSETKSLKEKKYGKSSKNNEKVIAIYFFLAVAILFICYALIIDNSHIILKWVSLLSAIIFITNLKRYFNTEIGERFLIPKNKIIQINSTEKTLTLLFVTLDDFREEIKLKQVEGDIEQIEIEIKTISNRLH
jgi:hypothetical protein